MNWPIQLALLERGKGCNSQFSPALRSLTFVGDHGYLALLPEGMDLNYG